MSFLSRTVTPADGIQETFNVGFAFNSREDVYVYLHSPSTLETGVALTVDVDYEWVSDGQITFLTGAPAAGQVVDIRRQSSTAQPTNTLAAGAIVAREINENDTQLLFLYQELLDQVQEGSVPDLSLALAGNGGFTLVKHKRAEANTYARTLSQLDAFGALDSRGVSVVHWIDPDLDDGILAGANAVDLQPYFANAAAAMAAAAGKKLLQIPGMGLSYKIDTTLDFAADDLRIEGYGATLTSAKTDLSSLLSLSGDNIEVAGLGLYLSVLDDDPWNLNVTGQNVHLQDCKLRTIEGKGHYQAYVRYTADGFQMVNCETSGSNGIYCEASRLAFLGNRFTARVTGGDDMIALKAIQPQRNHNIRIIGNHFENGSAFCSIGSEVGNPGAADADRLRGWTGVKLLGNTGRACSNILYIKPGAITGYDYRDGLVEDVECSNNRLDDPTGLKFDRGIAITADRGALVRNIYGKDNVIRARRSALGGRSVGTIDIYGPNEAAGAAGEAQFEDIRLQCAFFDPYQGQTNGAGRPGYPVDYGVAVQAATYGQGVFRDIELDVLVDGSAQTGGIIGPTAPADLDDQVRIRAKLDNVNRSDQAGQGGLMAFNKIKVHPETEINCFAGIVNDNPYVWSAAGGFSCPEYIREAFHAASIGAAVNDTRRPLAAPRRAMLAKVQFSDRAGIAQSDANNVVLGLAKNGAAAFHTPTTKATGGTEASPAINLTANSLVTILDAITLTNAANIENLFFAADDQLSVVRTHNGTGAAITDSRIRASWIPY